MQTIVAIEFKTEYENGREVEYVLVAPSGEGYDRSKTWHRINHIKPSGKENADNIGDLAKLDRWAQIEKKYNAWKEGSEIPEDGTPLAAWAGLTQDQASFVARMGIRTVEAVAAMSESTVAKLPWPNSRRLPELAKDFLSSRDSVAREQEMADMREKMAVMEEMLAAQMAEKRGPGRPRKQVDEEAAA